MEKDRTKSAHLKWPRGWSDGGRRLAAPDVALHYFHLTGTRRDTFTTYAAMRSHDESWNHMAMRRWLMFPSRASRGSFGVLFLADLQLSRTVPMVVFVWLHVVPFLLDMAAIFTAIFTSSSV